MMLLTLSTYDAAMASPGTIQHNAARILRRYILKQCVFVVNSLYEFKSWMIQQEPSRGIIAHNARQVPCVIVLIL